jgi:hypothetical protein
MADISADIFQYLTANGQKGAMYQNIRKNTNNNSPVTVLSDNDLRCNVGGASGSATSVVSVAAGSSVSFTADQVCIQILEKLSIIIIAFLTCVLVSGCVPSGTRIVLHEQSVRCTFCRWLVRLVQGMFSAAM